MEIRNARALRGLAAAALLCFTGCFSRPTAEPPIEWLDYRLDAPDELQVTILPDPVIEQEVVVRPDGMVTIQLIGDVQAGGRTTNEVAAEIQERIARYKRGAVVTVALSAVSSDMVTVVGEVGRPQTIALTRTMRVSDIIGTAGDITYLANKDNIRVVRPGNPPEVIIVDFAAIRTGDLSTNVQLYGGDIVYVEPTLIGKFGYFLRQILFPFDPIINTGQSVVGL